jgi:protein TonB
MKLLKCQIMSTINKVLAIALTETCDEVVFENRNQNYGAYNLRKRYRKHLLVGFMFSAFVLGTSVIAPLIRAMYSQNHVVGLGSTDVEVILSDYKPDPPKLPDLPEIKPPINEVVFLQPVVRDSAPDNLDAIARNMTDALEANNSAIDTGVNIVATARPTEIEDDDKTVYWDVSEPATFEGGDINEFRKWVQMNVSYPQDALNSEVEGKVTVLFAVNSKGQVCDISIIRKLHPSIDIVVKNVLENSPRWQPAKNNGKRVKQMFSLPVFFQLQH